jgi:hypothetical protein
LFPFALHEDVVRTGSFRRLLILLKNLGLTVTEIRVPIRW